MVPSAAMAVRMEVPRRRLALVTVALALGACSDDEATPTTTDDGTEPGPAASGTIAPDASDPGATSGSPGTSGTASAPPATPRDSPATTTGTDPPPLTDAPTTTAAPDGEAIELGRSVDGRPITVIRRGTPGGTAIVAVGAIHGDEDAGVAIIDELRRVPVPDGIELWLVPSMNPDGQAADVRQNVNGVDLNRNFPENWSPLGEPGVWQYAGPSAASEPETQAMLALSERVQPQLTLWYHQDLFRINPATGLDGEIRRRYASLTGLPIVEVTGGVYTGTASQWSRTIAADGGIGFTIELGSSLGQRGARRHAAAVLTVAGELT